MLKQAETVRAISKEDYKKIARPLKKRLAELQHRVKDEKLPILVLIEGWSAAGKGSLLSEVILTLDPRNFKVRNIVDPTEEERRKPFLWRHWMSLPERGIMGVYDRGWYAEIAETHAEGGPAHHKQLHEKLASINAFERELADDGTLILKIFLHITQKEQKKRLDALRSHPSTAWRVDKQDYHNNKHYTDFFDCYEEMLTQTDTPCAPWHVVSGGDRRAAQAEVLQLLVENIEQALAARALPPAEDAPDVSKRALSSGGYAPLPAPILAQVPMDGALDACAYRQKLKKLRKKLARLHNQIYLRRIPVIIAYEGWDAAGKGGNIRRLTAALDPRGYEVVPISTPTPTELAHPYLWRFWAALPKDGHIAVFDRTWYGRVLVERVEGFATPAEWHRAYREINEFEEELCNWGAVLLKFWLHLSPDEQLRRFEARQNDPDKRWKITDEDWRNRDRWDDYVSAVDDMLRLTSTQRAFWTVVSSEDKRYGRIQVLETMVEALERRL